MKKEIMLKEEEIRLKLEQNFFWKGVYILRCLSDNNEYIQINRILKTDKDGVIYIGSSSYIPHRIVQLKVSILEAYKNPSNYNKSRLFKHTCGKKLLNSAVREIIKFEKLSVEIISSEENAHTDSHYILENEKLLHYENEFGEPPPFNQGSRF